MQKNLASLVNRYAAIAVAAAAFVGFSAPAFAAFPERPVRIIVPFSPGGGTDLISRLLGDGMSRELGQPVIVENKPGAGTTIGSDAVARSRSEEHTSELESLMRISYAVFRLKNKNYTTTHSKTKFPPPNHLQMTT